MMERVTSGEHLIAYGVFAPTRSAGPRRIPTSALAEGRHEVISRVAFISKYKNPNAGKLFLDYILSKRTENHRNKADLYSLRPDVDGEATIKGGAADRDKARPVPIDQTLSRSDQAKRLAFLSAAAGEKGTQHSALLGRADQGSHAHYVYRLFSSRHHACRGGALSLVVYQSFLTAP
jgi:iron(III) transport system substrate-binding protein